MVVLGGHRLPLPAGHALRASDLTIKRPGTGLPAAAFGACIGRKLRRAVSADKNGDAAANDKRLRMIDANAVAADKLDEVRLKRHPFLESADRGLKCSVVMAFVFYQAAL